MRESEWRRLQNLFEDGKVPIPKKSCNVIVSAEEQSPEKMLGVSSLRAQILLNSLAEPKAAVAEVPPRATKKKGGETYQQMIKAIPKLYKQHMANDLAVQMQHKKISTICGRELRRGLSKTSKTNPSLKNKRINKELQRLVNRLSREEKEKIKKEDAEMEIKRKNDDAEKEEMRQKRKFNYLMSQTEAFASFFMNRQKDGTDGSDGAKAAMKHLADVREFDSADSRRKAEQETEQIREEKSDGQYVYKDVGQPLLLKTKLKEYQLKGMNWLINLYNQGINGILADDMGLGKTVQTISLLGYLAETEDVWGLFLVITPASTLHNWENEFNKFIPDFKVIVYYGSLQERADLRKRFKHSHVIVTSYQVAVSDESILKKIRWQYMILDEAQAIKSISSQRWKILLGFKARNRCLLTGTPIQNNMQELWSLLHFIMPTLFDSLNEFSEWFLTDNGLDATQVDKLHTILKPFMLRRHKDDIKDEIGSKEMRSIYCTLSARQRVLYDEILNPKRYNSLLLRDEPEAAEKNEYENTIMYLKKVCNHPDLFDKPKVYAGLGITVDGDTPLVEHRSAIKRYISEETTHWAHPQAEEFTRALVLHGLQQRQRTVRVGVNTRRIAAHDDIVTSLIYNDLQLKRRKLQNNMRRFVFCIEKVDATPISTNLTLDRTKMLSPRVSIPKRSALSHHTRMISVPPINTFIADSGKLVELDLLLKRLKAEGHRPLIYFQMTKMMDLFEEYLVKMEYSYLRLDGSCKVSARKELVNEWQTKDIFVFILSTRAGGVGINLTAADTVIFYDSDWNPTVDQQAMDRVHRLGQTKKVTVYRLITRDSIEEKIMERANQKDEMQKIVIKGNVFEGK